jgi:hypothetical protein
MLAHTRVRAHPAIHYLAHAADMDLDRSGAGWGGSKRGWHGPMGRRRRRRRPRLAALLTWM